MGNSYPLPFNNLAASKHDVELGLERSSHALVPSNGRSCASGEGFLGQRASHANRLAAIEMGTSRTFGGTGAFGAVHTSEIACSKPSWPTCRHALIPPIGGFPQPIG